MTEVFKSLSDYMFDLIGYETAECKYCKKQIQNPKFKTSSPGRNERIFTPPPLCVVCSDKYSDNVIPFDLKWKSFIAELNAITGVYLQSNSYGSLLTKLKNNLIQKKVFNESYPFLFIYGLSGSGKTVLARALTKMYNGTILKAFDIHGNQKFIGSYYSNFLCIDDIGKEKIRNYTFELIDHRCDRRAYTVMTSQFTIDELEKEYSPEMADRIRHLAIAFEMPKHSWRNKIQSNA